LYNTIEALAVAIAAYEKNGNSYLKENKYDYDYEQDTNNSQLTKVTWSNKSMLRSYYNVDVYNVDATELSRPPKLVVTSEHFSRAETIRNFTKKLLFKALAYDPKADTNGFPPFELSIYQKVNQEEVSVSDFGFIASAPLYYDKESYAIELEKRMANSQHVGSIGGRVSLIDLEVTKAIWSNNYQTTIVQGLCDGNLYFFFSNATVQIKQGEKIEINGRIKSHILEKDKYPMTRLSYVKIKGREDAPKTDAQTDDDSYLFRQR
jgi:hypothetical protein